MPVSFVHFGRCEDTISWLALGAGVFSASQQVSTDGTALHVPGLPVLCVSAEPVVVEEVEDEDVEDEDVEGEADDELEGPGGPEDFEGVEGLEDVDLVDEGTDDEWEPGSELSEQNRIEVLPDPPPGISNPTNCPCSLRRSSPVSMPLTMPFVALMLGVWSLRRRY
ncbi:MAG: hypothetical protein RBU37_25775 [Myxococcota bacterium]|nr:hypothetical protein [Myxococcota bacterium]